MSAAELEPIVVRRYGDVGPLVVVLHGGPGAPGSAAPLARALGARFRVLEPLQRRSGSVMLTVDRHVEDLAVVAPPVALIVGWSWGAMLALSFAARHPERVESLVLIGSGTYDEATRAAHDEALARRMASRDRRRMEELDTVLSSGEPDERDRALAELGRLVARASAVDPVEAPNPDAALPADARGHEETWRDVLRLQREGIEPAIFGRIRCPVLMLHGDQDPHPGQAICDVLRRYLPQLEYMELQGCGHEPWHERNARERFQSCLEAWLTKPPRRGRQDRSRNPPLA